MFSSEGVQFHRCTGVLHRAEAFLWTPICLRGHPPSPQFMASSRGGCITQPPLLDLLSFLTLKLFQQNSPSEYVLRTASLLRSRFPPSSDLYLRYLESRSRRIFSLYIWCKQKDFSLAYFRKPGSKIGVTSLNSFTSITVNMGYSVPQEKFLGYDLCDN